MSDETKRGGLFSTGSDPQKDNVDNVLDLVALMELDRMKTPVSLSPSSDSCYSSLHWPHEYLASEQWVADTIPDDGTTFPLFYIVLLFLHNQKANYSRSKS